MKYKPAQPLSTSLEGLLKELGHDGKIREQRVVAQWPQLVGEKISAIAQADRVRDKILYVKVKSMSWRTELLFQKHQIIQNINEKIGENIVNDIRFF